MAPRIRTINEAYAEIKKEDPKSCLTLNGLKVMVRSGKLPTIKSGKKYLLDLDCLLKYLSGESNL